MIKQQTGQYRNVGEGGSRSAITTLLGWLVPVQVILMVGVVSFMIGVTGTLSWLLLRGDLGVSVPAGAAPPNPITARVVPPTAASISPIFTPEIQYWAPKIMAWSRQYSVDPNMLAVVMQIESCGDPQAGSSAGAQGLFQVMPFHFNDGEDAKDPDTNAKAGIKYFKESLSYADGHLGLALAGYNGGIGIIDGGWARWASETRRYYIWGTGIYMDVVQGKTSSDSLKDWLNAGGSILCSQAAARQAAPAPVGQLPPNMP